jgi:hypothetical protein
MQMKLASLLSHHCLFIGKGRETLWTAGGQQTLAAAESPNGQANRHSINIRLCGGRCQPLKPDCEALYKDMWE